jgi:predicted metal-binding membrane protein
VAPKMTVPFAAGFLAPWIVVGFAAYGAVEAVRALDPAFLAWDRAGPYVAGAVIVGAAMYELTSPKRSCLRRCRDPRPPDGPGLAPALRAGIATGVICIGCCWALMAALFALGVMSVGWMVLIAALIAAEKLLPSARTATLGTAALLAILGIAVALAPEQVPGLTVPAETMPDEMMPDEMMMPG